MRSSEVGSAQCRSSKASATGCERAPARTQAVIAASCRRRNSSGVRLAALSLDSGMSTSGASSGAYSLASKPISLRVFSRSARRLSAGSPAPNRWRPHSATGCIGVFCSSCDDDDSSSEACGTSTSWARNSSISRDLPIPGSPTTSANWPSPLRARSQRRVRCLSSSSRPTRGERERAPPRRSPLARNHLIERYRGRQALEVVRSAVFSDEQSGDLALDARGDHNRTRLGEGLHTGGDIGRLTKHFARRVDYHRAEIEADARGELR